MQHTIYTYIVLYRRVLLHTVKYKTILCVCLIALSIVILMIDNLVFAVASNETVHDLDPENSTHGMPSLTEELDHDILPLINLIMITLLIAVLVMFIVIMVWVIRQSIRDLRRLKKQYLILHDMPRLLYVAIILSPIILGTSIVFMINESENIFDVLPTIIALLATIVLSVLSMWLSKWYTTTGFQEMYKKLNDTAADLTNLKQEAVADKCNLNSIDSTLNNIHGILDKINKKLDKPGER